MEQFMALLAGCLLDVILGDPHWAPHPVRAMGALISINLIPHTIEVTTLKHLKAQDWVNLEIDTLARYIERMVSLRDKEGDDLF